VIYLPVLGFVSLPWHRPGDERGASYVEYAFLVALIAIVCLIAVSFLGAKTSENMSRSASAIQ
jgi:Flp pilus assembly pilin Flp